MVDWNSTDQWVLLNSNGMVVAVRRTRSECVKTAEKMWSGLSGWRQLKAKYGWRIERCSIVPRQTQGKDR